MRVPNTEVIVPVEEGYFNKDYVPFDVCVVSYLAACGIEPSLKIETTVTGEDTREPPMSSKILGATVTIAIVAIIIYVYFTYLRVPAQALMSATKTANLNSAAIASAFERGGSLT